MSKVDARGLSCPEPVILTMNEINKGEKEIEVLVDAKVCVENITRIGGNQGFKVTYTESNGEFTINLKK